MTSHFRKAIPAINALFTTATIAMLAISSQANAGSFAYVADSGNSEISAYSIDKATGMLTQISGSPFSAGSDVNWLTVHPSGKFLFVTNENNGTVGVYGINGQTGALTPVSGSPFASGGDPNCPRVSGNGKFLYVPCEDSSNIYVYSIDQKTGALTQITGSPFSVSSSDSPDSIAIDHKGPFAYATTGDFSSSSDQVLGFKIDTKTGALSPLSSSPFTVGFEPDSLVIDPQGTYLFVANFSDKTVSVLHINKKTGALSEVSGSPFSVGGSPDEVTIDHTGRLLYTANDGDFSSPTGVGAFTIDRKTGALSPVTGTPFTAGSSTSGVTVDPSGGLLYAANENSGNVSVFSIDKKTGKLAEVSGSPFSAGGEPVKIAIKP